MRRIIVKIKDAKEKVYAANSFFDAMNFGVDLSEGIYFKDYYGTRAERDLLDRHSRVLKSIPIEFCCVFIKRGRSVK